MTKPTTPSPLSRLIGRFLLFYVIVGGLVVAFATELGLTRAQVLAVFLVGLVFSVVYAVKRPRTSPRP